MLSLFRRPSPLLWRLVLLAVVIAVGLAALVGCDDSDSDTLTPPPATVISASESPTAVAPQGATSAPPQTGQPGPTPTEEEYPKPVVTTPTPWVYPTK